jgi:hypothetical protein
MSYKKKYKFLRLLLYFGVGTYCLNKVISSILSSKLEDFNAFFSQKLFVSIALDFFGVIKW